MTTTTTLTSREDIERAFQAALTKGADPDPRNMSEIQLLTTVGQMCLERGIRLIHIPNKRVHSGALG